ncbi:MAG: dihydrofolate reductase [Gammaproteobacteria bacterium]
MSQPEIALIVAMARERVIGRDNALPWKLSADLQRFKALTMGCPIVMGRLTYESIGRPLPGRRNIVLTRDGEFAADGCEVMSSLAAALALEVPRIFVIGGAQIYTQALEHASHLYITQVDADIEGDTWFPEVDFEAWSLKGYAAHTADERNDHPYAFFDYQRRLA